MKKISSTIVGAAGEHHVLSQLLRRGWIAALAPDGAPNMDILVTDENNQRLCAIQVKTRRDIGYDKGWHMKPKHEEMVVDDLFYVFVDVGKQPSDRTTCYILPSKVVADCIRLCHRVWLDTPDAADGPTRIATCGGYGLTTLPSILFPKTARQSLIDIGPAGWNLTARTGASWVCRRRMVSDQRAWPLHLSSGNHFACSAWR